MGSRGAPARLLCCVVFLGLLLRLALICGLAGRAGAFVVFVFLGPVAALGVNSWVRRARRGRLWHVWTYT